MDLIDRQKLIHDFDIPKCMIPQESVIAVIDRQPSAVQLDDHRLGYWIQEDITFRCSECGWASPSATHYCGNCGAYMIKDTRFETRN